jgi:hypothetical protein
MKGNISVDGDIPKVHIERENTLIMDTEWLKVVLPKLIHSDQKGFVKGRNISEANRLIQDVIEYTDREDDDGIIIFLDQQKVSFTSRKNSSLICSQWVI